MVEFENDNILSESLTKQLNWLQSWKNSKGAYNGFVVHRFDLKRMFKTHDTPWSQAPIIKGFINLYNKTKKEKWLNEAILAADLQCTRLNKTGEYKYTGFEDDRFSSLVHNSLANCALLDLAQCLISINKKNDAEKYIQIVQKNIDEYIIGVLWDNQFGAFRFSKVDFYTPDTIRYTVNMNSVAVESLIKLLKITDNNKYLDYILRVGKWIVTEQTKSDGIESGGINYSHVQPGISISIYTALAMRGLDDLYKFTGDKVYKNMITKAAEHLINIIDQENSLFYHATLNKQVLRYPEFIAGAGLIFCALDDAEDLCSVKYEYEKVLSKVLTYQLPNGGFSNFIGYNEKFKDTVWEDYAPIMGWNGPMFEFLSRKTVPNEKSKIRNKHLKIHKNFIYLETKKLSFILGLRPFKSICISFIVKQIPFNLFYLSPFVLLIKVLAFLRLENFVRNTMRKK